MNYLAYLIQVCTRGKNIFNISGATFQACLHENNNLKLFCLELYVILGAIL